MKELNREDFLALFDPSVHERILQNAAQTGVEAVVCFENLDMSSSHLGHRTALIVGPGCTYTLVDMQKPGARLGDVPSRFQYPVSFWRIPI